MPTIDLTGRPTMPEAELHTPARIAVDWRELADQVFPIEALQMTPVVSPFLMVGYRR